MQFWIFGWRLRALGCSCWVRSLELGCNEHCKWTTLVLFSYCLMLQGVGTMLGPRNNRFIQYKNFLRMGFCSIPFFYCSPRLKESSVWHNACFNVELSSVDRDGSPNHIETIGGCPRFHLHVRVSNLPWMMNITNQEWRMQQMKWHVSSIFELLMCINSYRWICAIDKRGNCWCTIHHSWVGEFKMGRRSPFGLRFEWNNGEEWCGWPTNTNGQESSSMRVCPLTINFLRGALFTNFSCRCDEHASFYG